MLLSPTEYRLQEEMVRLIERSNLDFNGLRLFHGLHALAERVLPGRSLTALTLSQTATPEILTAELVRFIYPLSTNDLDALRAGVVSLGPKQLFTKLSHDKAGRRIVARFANHVANASAILKNRRFAILDADEVRQCSGVAELLFYTRVAMHQRSHQPMFQLPSMGKEEPWSVNSMKRWVRAAQRYSLKFDHTYLFQTNTCQVTGRATDVTVKITHRRSQWSPGCLYDSNAKRMPTVVHLGHAQRLDRSELQNRKAWMFADRAR